MFQGVVKKFSKIKVKPLDDHMLINLNLELN